MLSDNRKTLLDVTSSASNTLIKYAAFQVAALGCAFGMLLGIGLAVGGYQKLKTCFKN